MAADAHATAEFVLKTLAARGISPSEIGPNTTVGDVAQRAAYRGKLALLNELVDLPWQELKTRVPENRLPSGVIQSALTRFRPDTREWKGSDLADGYLACLSAYADVTYMDKRTHEAFRVARQKSEEFRGLVKGVEKARNYWEINLLCHRLLPNQVA